MSACIRVKYQLSIQEVDPGNKLITSNMGAIMNLDLSREAMELLKEATKSQSGEFTRIVSGRTVKFECNGHTLNDPTSPRSTTDWEEATGQLIGYEFIEEGSNGIYTVTTSGKAYVDSHFSV